jgi:hypothetical protein
MPATERVATEPVLARVRYFERERSFGDVVFRNVDFSPRKAGRPVSLRDTELAFRQIARFFDYALLVDPYGPSRMGGLGVGTHHHGREGLINVLTLPTFGDMPAPSVRKIEMNSPLSVLIEIPGEWVTTGAMLGLLQLALAVCVFKPRVGAKRANYYLEKEEAEHKLWELRQHRADALASALKTEHNGVQLQRFDVIEDDKTSDDELEEWPGAA